MTSQPDARPTPGATTVTTTTTASMAAIECRAVRRDFASGNSVVHALAGIDLRVELGELVAVRGRSGSGKTTLLNVLGGLDQPTSGEVFLDGRQLGSLTRGELTNLRRREIGFIFQGFGLLPILSAAENVEIPLRMVSTESAIRTARVAEVLDLVGLAGRAGHRPTELSGGEQQRVAIARA
ncbi:MAG: ABC transporter ATP-binding protein, partial [Candidatus Limnocylindrales bacterium]